MANQINVLGDYGGYPADDPRNNAGKGIVTRGIKKLIDITSGLLPNKASAPRPAYDPSTSAPFETSITKLAQPSIDTINPTLEAPLRYAGAVIQAGAGKLGNIANQFATDPNFFTPDQTISSHAQTGPATVSPSAAVVAPPQPAAKELTSAEMVNSALQKSGQKGKSTDQLNSGNLPVINSADYEANMAANGFTKGADGVWVNNTTTAKPGIADLPGRYDVEAQYNKLNSGIAASPFAFMTGMAATNQQIANNKAQDTLQLHQQEVDTARKKTIADIEHNQFLAPTIATKNLADASESAQRVKALLTAGAKGTLTQKDVIDGAHTDAYKTAVDLMKNSMTTDPIERQKEFDRYYHDARLKFLNTYKQMTAGANQ